jgi:hypothetical protein
VVFEADRFIKADPGSMQPVGSQPVPVDLQGLTCDLRVVTQNGASVHPGNTAVVTTGSSTVEAPGVEDLADGRVVTVEPVQLGSTIEVSLRMGPRGVSSLGFVVEVDCPEETGPTPAPVVEGEQQQAPESESTAGPGDAEANAEATSESESTVGPGGAEANAEATSESESESESTVGPSDAEANAEATSESESESESTVGPGDAEANAETANTAGPGETGANSESEATAEQQATGSSSTATPEVQPAQQVSSPVQPATPAQAHTGEPHYTG